MKKKTILCVIGTRPEAIKMAPVILALKNKPWVSVRVLATAQHRQMLDQVLSFFNIHPDIDLDIMLPNQTLTTLTARLLLKIEDVLITEKPDIVLVQGDTTTVMSIALACFYHHIPVGHIEAGLRTWNLQNPFPEEANRVIVSKLARWHFAPTEGSRKNLLKEKISEENIIVTGNTVIDALLITAAKNLKFQFELDNSKKLLLVTSHRRENFGKPFENICLALLKLAELKQDIQILFPVHPNPNVKEVAYRVLGNNKNIILSEPLDYAQFVGAMKNSYMIITDSGGVQEEAPALGKPVLVLRNETERPEAVKMGVVKLIGANYDRIIKESKKLLENNLEYSKMAKGVSPYGDGHSAERIEEFLRRQFI